MGLLIYGEWQRYEFDDRQLAHVKAAVRHKLRMHECFLMSWVQAEHSMGRISVWMSPEIPLTFQFAGSRRPTLNEHWVRVMEHMSNTPRGMVVLSEEEAMQVMRDAPGTASAWA